jgi:hypothetical protein
MHPGTASVDDPNVAAGKHERNAVMNSTGRALALGLVVCGAGHAQDTESFRLRTTGGLIPDDLDLIVDPVELGHVEGLHVYTNLSNLGSGDETALGSQTDNSGMIGFGGEVGRFKLGALVGTRTSELDNPVSIDLDQNGSYDLFGTGFLQGSLIEYLGWEGGNYTFRNVRDYRAASYQDLDETRLVFTTNLGLGGGRFGARVLYNDQSQDSESSDSFMNTQEDLGLDYAMTEDLLTRRYYSRSAGRELGLEIGTSRETVRGELQLAAGVIRQTTEWADIYRYDDVDLDFNPTGFIEDYRNRSTHDDEFQDETTLGLHARIGLRRTREKAAERRNDSFQHLQAVIGFDQGDRKDQYSRHVDAFDADEHFYTHEGLMVRTVEEGDVSRLHLGIDHRLVRALDDQVRFAMGVSLHHTRYTADLSGSGSSFNADSTLGSDGILNGNDRIQLDRSGTFHEREIRTLDLMERPGSYVAVG